MITLQLVGIKDIGVGLGFLYFFMSISAVVGTPIAGKPSIYLNSTHVGTCIINFTRFNCMRTCFAVSSQSFTHYSAGSPMDILNFQIKTVFWLIHLGYQ